MNRFKTSKYKNCIPKIPKKEGWITDIGGVSTSTSGNNIRCGHRRIVYSTDSPGVLGLTSLQVEQGEKRKISRLHCHSDVVTDFAFSPFDDDLLATGSADQSEVHKKMAILMFRFVFSAFNVKLWHLSETGDVGDSAATLTVKGGHVKALQFHPSADALLVSAAGKSVQVWDLSRDSALAAIPLLHTPAVLLHSVLLLSCCCRNLLLQLLSAFLVVPLCLASVAALSLAALSLLSAVLFLSEQIPTCSFVLHSFLLFPYLHLLCEQVPTCSFILHIRTCTSCVNRSLPVPSCTTPTRPVSHCACQPCVSAVPASPVSLPCLPALCLCRACQPCVSAVPASPVSLPCLPALCLCCACQPCVSAVPASPVSLLCLPALCLCCACQPCVSAVPASPVSLLCLPALCLCCAASPVSLPCLPALCLCHVSLPCLPALCLCRACQPCVSAVPAYSLSFIRSSASPA
ncbi:unnamed protein product [Ranitomeya imitator]|uniref:Coronin n=1 Tax=Ranitomeya imitator TaxID=111125 RepID=A0ABN9M2Z7_9NEOB|nr:unnamed protein product [Ranitomeya imitator]